MFRLGGCRCEHTSRCSGDDILNIWVPFGVFRFQPRNLMRPVRFARLRTDKFRLVLVAVGLRWRVVKQLEASGKSHRRFSNGRVRK